MHTRSSDVLVTRSQKRKRRSSGVTSNIENEPIKEEKRFKEDRSEEGECSAVEGRFPLSELSIVDHVVLETDTSELILEQDPERFLTSSFSSPDSNCEPLSVESLPGCSSDDLLSLDIIKNNFNLEICSRGSPWPGILRNLEWADVNEWWDHYVHSDKETADLRNPQVFDHHPGLQPRMRAVLLEWLIEVCDVFKLHRETYYLTLDFLDRYLESTKNVPKAQLQLIGISCLLIASKAEEIYPPKVSEYAFVTDGACNESDIIRMELSIIKVLNWKFKIITPNCWLLIYLQLGYMKIRKEKNFDAINPMFPTSLYKTAAQLLDLVSLDINCLAYKYSVLAISALHIVCCQKFPLEISGYEEDEIKDCVTWMEVFWRVMCEKNIGDAPSLSPAKSSRTLDHTYLLQQHVVSMELLESAQNLACEIQKQSMNLLTPPQSSEKGRRKN